MSYAHPPVSWILNGLVIEGIEETTPTDALSLRIGTSKH